MKALVYHGANQRSWDTVPDPQVIDPTDAIVRIDSSTICGSDLHILKGDVPETTPGTALGHEAIGTVQEVVGAMGSRRAQSARRERLLDAGLRTDELDRLSAPVGLDLGASSPQETALSMLAEVVAVRHGHHGGRLGTRDGRIHAAQS